jgi:hypothetical protein
MVALKRIFDFTPSEEEESKASLKSAVSEFANTP